MRPTAASGGPAWRPIPRTFQGRLTIAIVGVVALTLLVLTVLIINRLDDFFGRQEADNLQSRMTSVAGIVLTLARSESSTGRLVLPDGTVDPQVDRLLRNPTFLGAIANQFALADVQLQIGTIERDSADMPAFVPVPGAAYLGKLTVAPAVGQAREALARSASFPSGDGFLPEAAIDVAVSDPYTFRTSTIATITGLVVISALVGLLVAMIVAAYLARRFTTPLRRLTVASRELGGGDMSQRVPTALAETGSVEVAELTRQFNAMAARLQDSMEIIRRDRDRSRDFLADVSHELRTPIAALRTFNDLLREGAVEDPTAAEEFLESSGQQIDRLDWLAQNLLELSKLDSGLLQLDLRPDDLRACVESAVEQAEAAARKRGVTLTVAVPDRPIRIRHDPQRIGQVVANLVGNSLKFSPRGGTVTVTLAPHREGARIVVADTGVGIDASELPHIFERFYRGSRSNEARASGSGLGLAIVKSIVDMHGGRIAVDSRLGVGTTFTVTLPRDPRATGPRPGESAAKPPADGTESPRAESSQVADSSPSGVRD
ncbi:MAG: HAMP domain-containing sensor histidine kinase [Chloroflexota bacterium]